METANVLKQIDLLSRFSGTGSTVLPYYLLGTELLYVQSLFMRKGPSRLCAHAEAGWDEGP